MQFLAQLRLSDADPAPRTDGLLLLFQCMNTPLGHQQQSPDGGGTFAVVVGQTGGVLAAPPELTDADERAGRAGPRLLFKTDGVKFEHFDLPADLAGREGAYAAARARQNVLGVTADRPLWVQADQTPSCPNCDQPMRFVVQLEEAGGGGMTFGDAGCGYGFICEADRAAAFFSQSG